MRRDVDSGWRTERDNKKEETVPDEIHNTLVSLQWGVDMQEEVHIWLLIYRYICQGRVDFHIEVVFIFGECL